jgi:DNA-binding beta-propeller fold protein YncE
VRLSYPATTDLLYVIADGASSSAIRLAAVPGAGAPSDVVANELTTVATAFAMSQFLKGGTISGLPEGLALATATAASLVNPATGEATPSLSRSMLAQIHTLANLLAWCVQSKERDACHDLFAESRAAGIAMPANTLDAALAIAHNPANNVVPLYHLAPRDKPYAPALTESPESWVLSLRHGAVAPGDAPSGLRATDPEGNVWVTNDRANSVSRFDAKGNALSPPGGWKNRRIRKPRGIRSDACGNIWIANSGGASVTRFPRGDPQGAQTYEVDMREPSGIAIDAAGSVWITGSGNGRVAKLNPDGTPAPGSPFILRALDKPLDIAIDSAGNAWVSNHSGRSVTMFRPDGLDTHTFTGGGIDGPWGIAVDGRDNIFVANSKHPSLSILCGARPENCPQGKQTGDAISPAGGYTSDTLSQPSWLAIDLAGNVRIATAGGVVEFIGLAAPVAGPLIGPPRQPGQPLPRCGK